MEKLARNEGSSSHSSSTGCFAGLRQGTFLDRRPSHKHLTGVARVTRKQLLSSGGCNPQKIQKNQIRVEMLVIPSGYLT